MFKVRHAYGDSLPVSNLTLLELFLGNERRRELYAASRHKSDVSPDKTDTPFAEHIERDVTRQRHLASVDLKIPFAQHYPARRCGSHDRSALVAVVRYLLHSCRLVCADNHDTPLFGYPIHQSEQGSNNTTFHIAMDLVSLRSEGVELINEND